MNRQDKWKDGVLISRGIEWTAIWGRPGYTANPVRGCPHGCEWEMPDGSRAECYAKTIAEKLARKAYPKGFAHVTFRPEELEAVERLKDPAGIFIDSMTDLFSQGVEADWIYRTLLAVRKCEQHVFFSLTKNPGRLKRFGPFPKNMLVGVSVPPTFMFGKRLTLEQQIIWLDSALRMLEECGAVWRWCSIEPLSWDVSHVLARHPHALHWAVIGAASNRARTYQPDKEHFRRALAVLDGCKTKVFFKGNLSRNLADEVAGGWREEFPEAVANTADAISIKPFGQRSVTASSVN